MQRRSANFARPLGDVVGHGEDLFSLLVQEQMIVAKMAAAHMPVEILRLQVKRKHVGKEAPKFLGYLCHSISAKIGRRFESGLRRSRGSTCIILSHFLSSFPACFPLFCLRYSGDLSSRG
jgi:hypothetical protein